jgi:hypothetical protein
MQRLAAELFMPRPEGRAAKRFDAPKAQANVVGREGLLSRQAHRQAPAAPPGAPSRHRPRLECRRDSARQRPNVPQAFPVRSSHWHCECRVRRRPTRGNRHREEPGSMPARRPVLAGQAHTQARNQIRAATPYAPPYARYTPTNPNCLKSNHESEAKQTTFLQHSHGGQSRAPGH